jgi:hypothetical protein
MNGTLNLFGDIIAAPAPRQECEHPRDARILNGNLFTPVGSHDEVCALCNVTTRHNVATFNRRNK